MSLGKRHPPPVRGLLHKFYLRRTSSLPVRARVSTDVDVVHPVDTNTLDSSSSTDSTYVDITMHISSSALRVLVGLLMQSCHAPGTTIRPPRAGPTQSSFLEQRCGHDAP